MVALKRAVCWVLGAGCLRPNIIGEHWGDLRHYVGLDPPLRQESVPCLLNMDKGLLPDG